MMHTTISEVSKMIGHSGTHVKNILKSIYNEDEINRSSTGTKILLSPEQVRNILSHENKLFKKTIATISQQKGGVGKTTITINVAVKASTKGARVLIVDVDPESNASSFFLQEEIFENTDIATIKEILKREVNIEDSILRTRYDYIDIIPCRGTARKADRELHGKNLGTSIRSLLQPLLQSYDLILIDQGPSFNPLNVSCYLACDKVLMPVDDSRFSIEGVSLTIDDIHEESAEFNVQAPMLKIIKNTITNRKNSGKDALEAIDENFGEYLTDITIPEATIFTNSTNNNLSIFESKAALPKHKAPFDKIFNQIIEFDTPEDDINLQ